MGETVSEPSSYGDEAICIVGIWHQGAVAAACLADAGHTVIGVDGDPGAVTALAAGRAPLFEPGLDELLASGIASGRLTFTTDIAAAVASAATVMVMFDTPVNDSDDVDLSTLMATVRAMAPHLRPDSYLLVTAQVPVGTCDRIREVIREANPAAPAGIAYSPENLRLGQAIELYRHPQLPVVGSDDPVTLDHIESVLAPVGTPWVRMGLRSAEMTKHALNSFLAMSVAFGNEIADICDLVGADGHQVANALRREPRIGAKAPILPGLGFSGGTLARDVRALQSAADELDHETALLDGIWRANELHNRVVIAALERHLGSLSGRRIGVLGLTYKPGTSTLRRSLSLEVSAELAAGGATVIAFDPQVTAKESSAHPYITTVGEPLLAADDADAVVIMTPWPEFRDLDFAAMARRMKRPLLLDPSNFLDAATMVSLGVEYVGVGRGATAATVSARSGSAGGAPAGPAARSVRT
jgi:UDPglucose 6-dehydrogenase